MGKPGHSEDSRRPVAKLVVEPVTHEDYTCMVLRGRESPDPILWWERGVLRPPAGPAILSLGGQSHF